MKNGDYSSLDKPLHCLRNSSNNRSVDRLSHQHYDSENHHPNIVQIKKPERNRSLSNHRGAGATDISHDHPSELFVNYEDIEEHKE